MNLTLKNLQAGYDNEPVLKHFSAEISQSVAILGPNGCGKTTLLKAIGGLLPYEGTITLDGQNLKTLGRKELAGKVALMSQIRQQPFPYTVWETVMLGRYRCQKRSIFGSVPSSHDRQTVTELLTQTGLWDLRHQPLTQLSGGQLQRVFLAQTLAQDPQIILLDEPTNHLDVKYQLELIDYLKNWAQTGNRLVIGVFHDLNLALRLTDTLLFLKDGQVAGFGKASDVMTRQSLFDLYGIDIAAYMQQSLLRWQDV